MAERQAGICESEGITVTPQMIEAGWRVYQQWEPDNIFDPYGGPGEYAIRELLERAFQAMQRAADSARA